MDEQVVFYLAPSGKDTAKGSIDAPIKTIAGIKWPEEGGVVLHPETGMSLAGSLEPSAKVSSLKILPIRNRRRVKGNWRCDAVTYEDLPERDKVTIERLTCSCEITAWNTTFTNSPNITLTGTTGKKEEDNELKHAMFRFCTTPENWDFSRCEAAQVVCRECKGRGLDIKGFKSPGRVHLQGQELTEDIEVDDDTDIELICGTTQKDRKSKDFGKQMDTCSYRSIKHASGKSLPASFSEKSKLAGTGKGDPKAKTQETKKKV